MKIAGLTGQYIQVSQNKGKITYGGDQGFFAGASCGSPDERKQKLGCGITAFGDLLLYLAGRDIKYRIRETENYENRILSEEEYKSYYNQIYEYLGGIQPKAQWGLSGLRLQRRFNRMARRQGWKLRAKWGCCGRWIYKRTLEMLHKDIPVILCIPILFGNRNKDKGIILYKKDGDAYRKVQTVSAHYVTVTGVIKEDRGPYFEISSWGKRYYINWQEYKHLIYGNFLGTILGNILYIR